MPRDGRWCGRSRCGGRLEYRRRLVGDALVDYLVCWSCGARRETYREPYRPGVPPEAGEKKPSDDHSR